MSFFQRHGTPKNGPKNPPLLPERHVDDLARRPRFELEPQNALGMLEHIRRGVSPHAAMIAVGWAPSAFRTWRDRAAAGTEPYVSFFAGVQRALAEAHASASKAMLWKNPEAYLTRGPGRLLEVDPDQHWKADKGNTVTVQTAVVTTGGEHDLDRLTVEELKALEAMLQKTEKHDEPQTTPGEESAGRVSTLQAPKD